MVKPDQIQSNRDSEQQADIEEYFDKALLAGEREIEEPRAAWLRHNMEAVLNKYHAHWSVIVRGATYVFSARSRTLGQIGYEAYAEVVGGPPWTEISNSTKAVAWDAAAAAIKNAS